MEKSQSIKNLAGALLAFQLKADKINKDANNPFFKSKYASLSHILESIQIPLAESGLAYTQFPTGDYGLTTILIHPESGEYIQAEYSMKPTKDDPQGRGSSITYQRRYGLVSILGLNVDDDDDANEASKQTEKKAPTANEKPWLNINTKEFEGAVKKLKSGSTTIDKIKTVMRVSKETEAKLIEATKQPNA